MTLALIAFWLMLFLVVYPYTLYPVLLLLLATIRDKIPKGLQLPEEGWPTVSLVIAVHNEQSSIRQTLSALLALDYPRDRLEVIVASDCSDDATDSIVLGIMSEDPRVRLVRTGIRVGQVGAKYAGFVQARGQLLGFLDGNTVWAPSALKELVRGVLSSERVWYVTGRLVYTNTSCSSASRCEGLHWQFEHWLKLLESRVLSVTAGNGGIYLVKRELLDTWASRSFIPVVSHDSALPRLAVASGKLAKYVPTALAYERAGETVHEEAARKKRMMTQFWWAVLHGHLSFSPRLYGFMYAWMLVSHRLLRYCYGWVFMGLFVVTLPLARVSVTFLALVVAQFVCYVLAFAGAITRSKFPLVAIPQFAASSIFATVWGFFAALRGNTSAAWSTAQRTR